MNSQPEPRDSNQEADPPPIFRTWPRLYALLFGELILIIFLSYLFMRTFS